MIPTMSRPLVTKDFMGQDYVTETFHDGHKTVKHHYPIFRG